MYPVDELDAVVELTDIPAPDVGAPLPIVLADDYRLLMAYLVSEPDPNWDGSYANIVYPDQEGMSVALVRFQRPYAHMFGPPNDEAFDGHPLANRGLSPYAAFEVKQSSWVRQLERMNSVHSHHASEAFMANKKHFVFAFHDSTFECIAEGFEVQVRQGSLLSALSEMARLLEEDPV